MLIALAPATAYVGMSVVIWTARQMQWGMDARLRLEWAMFALLIAAFLGASVIAALGANRRAVLAAGGVGGGSLTFAELVRLGLGMTLMPGMYQVDYEVRLFVIDNVKFAFLMGLWGATAAAAIGAGALAIRGFARRRLRHRDARSPA